MMSVSIQNTDRNIAQPLLLQDLSSSEENISSTTVHTTDEVHSGGPEHHGPRNFEVFRMNSLIAESWRRENTFEGGKKDTIEGCSDKRNSFEKDNTFGEGFKFGKDKKMDSESTAKDARLHCPSHEGSMSTHYCFTCSRLICRDCSCYRTPSHETMGLEEAITHRHEKLRQLVDALDLEIDTINEIRIQLAHLNRVENGFMFNSKRRSKGNFLEKTFGNKNKTSDKVDSKPFVNSERSSFRQSVRGSTKRLSVENNTVSVVNGAHSKLTRNNTLDNCTTCDFTELCKSTSSEIQAKISSLGNSPVISSSNSIDGLSISDDFSHQSIDGSSSRIDSTSLDRQPFSYGTSLKQENTQTHVHFNTSASTQSLPKIICTSADFTPGDQTHYHKKPNVIKDFIHMRRRKISTVNKPCDTFHQENETAKSVSRSNSNQRLSDINPPVDQIVLNGMNEVNKHATADPPKKYDLVPKVEDLTKRASLATFEDSDVEDMEENEYLNQIYQELKLSTSNNYKRKLSNSQTEKVKNISDNNSKNSFHENNSKTKQKSNSAKDTDRLISEMAPRGHLVPNDSPNSRSIRSSSQSSLISCKSSSSGRHDRTSSDEVLKDDEQISDRIQTLNQLCQLTGRTLETDPNGNLIPLYEQLSSSIQDALQADLPVLKEKLKKKMEDVTSRKIESKDAEKKNKKIPELGKFRSSYKKKSAVSNCSMPRVATSRTILDKAQLLWKVDRPSSDKDEISNASGVAVLSDGSVVVASYDNSSQTNNRLLHIDQNGSNIKTLTEGGIQPLGVVQTVGGHLAVTDCKGKRVRILSLTGQLMQDIGKGHFGWPYGITSNSRGQLIISDVFSDSISIFSMEGKKIRTFGASGGSNPIQFRNPYYVTVDWNDNIVVSDSGNNAIKVFDGDTCKLLYSVTDRFRKISQPAISQPLDFSTPVEIPVINGHASTQTVSGLCDGNSRTFSGAPYGQNRFKNPKGVTIDLSGNVLIADECKGVSAFDYCGRFMRSVLNDTDSVMCPEAIHMNDEGLLAISETNCNIGSVVKLFRIYD